MNVLSQNLSELLPDKVNGFKSGNSDTYYNQETLFEYINGGAELFISYNFDRVISRTYSQGGQADIVVEIFDMLEAKNAFGVFSHDREKLDATYGQGSETYQGAILFWKDRYYVSLFTEKENEVSGPAISSLAAEIDKLIPGEGKLPGVLDYLPEAGLVEESVFYFHHYIWLNAFFYISSDNFLVINESTDAVLAKYGQPDSRYYLLLIEYPSEEDARKAYSSFGEHYAPELIKSNIVKLEDGKWTGSIIEKKLLICVFNAPEEKQAGDLLNETLKKIGK